MAHHLPLEAAPRNFILKLKTNCTKCESKLKKFLLRTPGVHSAKIDAQQKTLSISGTMDPSTAIMLIEKRFRGLKAELLWDGQQTDGNDVQNVVAELAQLERFSGIEGLESVEIKLSFKGQNRNLINGDRNMEVMFQNEAARNQNHRHDQVLGFPLSPLVGPPSPWSGGYSPSAPPIWRAYYDAPPPPPPPERYTPIFNPFSDEATTWGRCCIM
ncbi:OLC1v1027643C1 [Oldenlandia corymbosa var. corymbosa]|uniref:OLC1v1027643C1 n=1 Tax=Oldenlandia corymbosa var. corymbosa TaxID=529605 RepID=A0AAV1C9Y5_OLDCO|nr:OLC1v1027643C1 [Oldenlandia corymbosa var. corymbosa]